MTSTRTRLQPTVHAAPAPRRTVAAVLRGLIAALVLILLTVGVPLVMIRIGAYPHGPIDLGRVGELLLRPGDGGLTLGLAVGVWVCWALFTVDVLGEVLAAVRTRGGLARPRRGGPFAGVATQLVHAVVVLFLAAPIALSVTPPAVAAAAGMSVSAGLTRVDPEPSTGPSPSVEARPTTGTSSRVGSAGRAGSDLPTVTVRRHDTLWKLAASHLGDPERWSEIRDLNPDQLTHGSTTIRPGQVLSLPADAVTVEALLAESVVVESGDTLSGIAREHGRPGWRGIFTANTGKTQPDGRHLSDPDLIRPGWRLDLPATGSNPDRGPGAVSAVPAASAASGTTPGRVTPTPAVTAPSAPAAVTPARPAPTPSATPSLVPTATSAATSTAASASATTPGVTPTAAGSPAGAVTATTPAAAPESGERPGWVLPGLVGAGSVLGAGMFLAYRRRRRELSRARRPGRMTAQPAPHLAPVEKTVVLEGSAFAPTVETMDAVLRRLAASRVAAGLDLPAVVAVELTQESVILHLAEPCDLDVPWVSDDEKRIWLLTGDPDDTTEMGSLRGVPAPYPLMVTVGAGDDHGVWLLNLEQLGVVTVTGDRDRGLDLARYVAAELACNPWSRDVTASCAGVGAEAARMAPARVRFHDDAAGAAAEILADASVVLHRSERVGAADAVVARIRQDGDEVWPGVLLLLDATNTSADRAEDVARLVQDHPGQTGTAVVLVSAAARPDGVVVEVTDEGRLRAPALGLDLTAVSLTADEAEGCAQLLEVGAEQPDVPIPVDPQATQGWQALCDEAGGLRTELTLPRDTPAQDLAEPAGSVLDAPDEDYLRVAATTVEDLETLAPLVPLRVRGRVEDADPTLDADVAMWFADDCPLPRLSLLGPVRARTRGNPGVVSNRKAYFTGLLAYLATRTHGATSDEVADAFDVQNSSARSYVKTLRQWLGTNPRTGVSHIPDAQTSPEALERGVAVYQVLDLLVDADLFRRLRVRGETRGPEGLADLIMALRLVSGRPFDQLGRQGWGWMLEGNRLDQHMICAIVDTAHVVVTDELSRGDITQARSAAQTALAAAPDEEIAQLDLAAVLAAEGHCSAADQVILEDVDGADEDDGPRDRPHRTQRVLAMRPIAK